MHFAYVDDSGDSRNGTTLSALIVEDKHWAGLLDAWLAGRRTIHRGWGVPKNRELHAIELYKGRGSYCETRSQELSFDLSARAAVGQVMLRKLAQFEHFVAVTIGSRDVSKPTAYARFIAWLEDWAAEHGTWLIVFYDGQQGLASPDAEPTPDELKQLWQSAVRAAGPYRRVHRDLDIGTRRILEDVVMQDSQFSQLIQAADLIAYGAYQRHRQTHPEKWGKHGSPSVAAIRAYMKTSRQWPAGSDAGVYWLD